MLAINSFLNSYSQDDDAVEPVESEVIEINDDYFPAVKEERSNIVNTFYQKCSQLTPSQPSSDDERNLSFLQSYSSHKNNNTLFKGKDKKSKHRDTCHKSKKFRSDSSKLRDLLKENKVNADDSNAAFNNSFTSNDVFRVNNINDIFVSSITPEYEVELETTPLEQLSRHDQITITKVETVPEKSPICPGTWKPDVTVEVKTNSEVIDSSIAAIKKEMHCIEPDDDPLNDPLTDPLADPPSETTVEGRNYLIQASACSYVPNTSSFNSMPRPKLEIIKPKEEPRPRNLLAAAYSMVMRTDDATKSKIKNSSPVKRKTRK